jgi:hypothetical protein
MNRQVRYYSTCICFVLLRFLSEVYKSRFQSGVQESFPTFLKEVNSDMENSDNMAILDFFYY